MKIGNTIYIPPPVRPPQTRAAYRYSIDCTKYNSSHKHWEVEIYQLFQRQPLSSLLTICGSAKPYMATLRPKRSNINRNDTFPKIPPTLINAPIHEDSWMFTVKSMGVSVGDCNFVNMGDSHPKPIPCDNAMSVTIKRKKTIKI